jgi:hypothetical protein
VSTWGAINRLTNDARRRGPAIGEVGEVGDPALIVNQTLDPAVRSGGPSRAHARSEIARGLEPLFHIGERAFPGKAIFLRRRNARSTGSPFRTVIVQVASNSARRLSQLQRCVVVD